MHTNGVELSAVARRQGDIDPYVLTTTGRTRRQGASKGGNSYSRIEESSTANGTDILTTSASDGPTSTNYPGSDVVSGLARRLDSLIDALAIRGEVEGSPPGYEAGADTSGAVPRP